MTAPKGIAPCSCMRALRAGAWILVLLVCLALRTSVGAATADYPTKCEICQETFTNKVYVVTDPVRQVKKHICVKCSKSKTVCSACGLAAYPKTLLKLPDGRILCDLDAKGAVLSEHDAQEIFAEVKRDVQRMLAHWSPLPGTNITFHLVDKNDFIKEYRRKPSIDNPELLLGLTRSRLNEETNFEHNIYVLSGVLRSQFYATCAHEYTHTWLNEHEQPARTLHHDNIEGFCELISWKYMTGRGDTQEVNRILENGYTRGQIHALIAAEKEYQFHRVINWIHRGMDSWLDADRPERLLALKDDRETEDPDNPAEPVWRQLTVATPVPDTLMLKGISGAGDRRFALINNQTLQRGESARVRLGTSNVVVRCLEIRADSVVVQVGESKEPVELSLPLRKTDK